jgi:predicted nucleic acid-binding protein
MFGVHQGRRPGDASFSSIRGQVEHLDRDARRAVRLDPARQGAAEANARFARFAQRSECGLVDESVARKFGEVRAWQVDHGLGSPELDLLNGAVALVHSLTMVTHNVQDYANIPGLTIHDWLVP